MLQSTAEMRVAKREEFTIPSGWFNGAFKMFCLASKCGH